MKIKLVKLQEAENPMYPKNIKEGHVEIREVNEESFKKPEIGKRFWIGTWSTSQVVEIIDHNTFRTLNSIYRWQYLDMTKDYALRLMREGYSIYHYNYMSHEFLYINDIEMIFDEHEIYCGTPEGLFWQKNQDWPKGWNTFVEHWLYVPKEVEVLQATHPEDDMN